MNDGLETIRAAAMAEAKRPAATRSWRSDAARLLALHAGVVAISVAVSVLVLGHVPLARGLSAPLLAAAIVSAIVAAVVPSPAGRSWALASLVTAFVASAIHLRGFAFASSAPLWQEAECALAELAIAAVPAIATVLTLRTFGYRRMRALVGSIAAALTGLLVLDLSCPADGAAHVLAFHLAPAALVVVVAMVIRAHAGSRAHVP